MVTVEYKIPMGQVKQSIAQEMKRIEAGLNAVVDELLDLTANTQILAYSAGANPAPPTGSTYDRTFTLQGSSETRRTGRSLPDIGGVWSANENKARAARFVIGKKAQQARIHRGRWKSVEEVTAEVQRAAPGVIKKHLKE